MDFDPPNGLTYLVTGGCGFVGRHLVRTLWYGDLAAAEIRVLDLVDPDGFIDWYTICRYFGIEPTHHRQTKLVVSRVDVTDYQALVAVMQGVDVVFHTAALVDFTHRHSPEAIYRVNVVGTRYVLAACKAVRVRAVVYTSSMEAVGPNKYCHPFVRGNEDTVYQVYHTHPYPCSKTMAERMVLAADGSCNIAGHVLRTCALRPTGVYGEGHQLMRDIYKRAVANRMTVQGCTPPETEHSRVYVGNVAWMHLLAARALLAADRCRVGGQAFYCYDDSPLGSYDHFNMHFLSQLGCRYKRVPVRMVKLLGRCNDGLRLCLKKVGKSYHPLLNAHTAKTACTTFSVLTNKAERTMGYTPLFTWPECLENTVGWLGGVEFTPRKRSPARRLRESARISWNRTRRSITASGQRLRAASANKLSTRRS